MLARILRHRAMLCGLFAAALYLSGLGRAPLWEPDEGRYAEIAREMVVSRDFITPRNNFVRYFEKPPLVYWATAASLELLGRNEFAVRFQAAVASAAEVAIVEALAETMFGASAAVIAAVALATSPLFMVFARFAIPDPMLAFFITAALGCFFNAIRAPDLRSGRGRFWMIFAAIMLALGTLTKGPVALVLGGGIPLIWMALEGRIRDVLRVPWLECVFVFAAITLPWFVVVARRNPGFLHFFFVHEHFQRYLENEEHGWGPWFFIPILIGGAWPWLYFVPAAFSSTQTEDGPRTPEVSSTIRFLLIWFGVIFVFFSIPRSKLGEYILPALPPIAMLAGYGVSRFAYMPQARIRRALAWLVVANTAAAVAMACGALVAVRNGVNHGLALDGSLAGIGFLAGALAAFLLACKPKRAPAVITASIAIGAVISLAAATRAREDVASLVSYRTLAETIEPYTSKGCLLASYHHFVQALPFYTGAREILIGYRGELGPFAEGEGASSGFIATDAGLHKLWAGSRCVVLVANSRDLDHLESIVGSKPAIIGAEGKKRALYNQGTVRTPLSLHSAERKSHQRG